MFKDCSIKFKIWNLFSRERKSGGIKWNSSKTGPVNTHTQQATKKKSSKGEKVKFMYLVHTWRSVPKFD